MKKLSLFILTCLLSITWAWADTSVTENYVTCTLTGAQTSRVSFNGKYSLWYYRNTRVLGSNDKLNDNTKGIWMSRGSGNSCYIESTLEGGIKAVSFKWRQFSDGDNGFKFILNINVDGTNKKKISFTGADSYFNTDQSYSQTLAIKSNSKLTIQNSSTQSDGTTAGGRLIVGPITITPYLLYTQKVVTIGSKQQGYYNDELIDNTGGEGTITYSSSAPSVATIDSESGVITPVAAGTTTITATWSEASTTYTLHVVDGIIAENFSKVVQTGQTASATWHGDLFDWSVANVRRGVDDTLGLAPRIQATALRSNTGSTITSVKAIEGGVKHVSFDWRQWGSGSGTLNMNMYYSSDPANWGEAVATQSVDAVGASEPHVFDMDIDDGTKGNAYLKLQYTSDAGVAVMGAMKITPYLLYTTKSHTLDTRVDELTYTNTGLIDNTSGDAVAYTISPADAGASINPANGEVTVTDETEGDFTVTATWGAVSTTYTLTVMSRTATTASYAEAVKRVGLDASPIDNPLTYTDGYDGTITYTSSNTDVATVADNGTVSLAGGVGQTTITATLPQTENYKAATASYTLYVTDNSSNVLVEAFSAVPTGNATAHAGKLWKGDVCDWRVSEDGAVRKNNDVFPSDSESKGIWMGIPENVSKYAMIQSEATIEGGIKYLSFYWEQWGSETEHILKPAVYVKSGEDSEVLTGSMEYTPSGDPIAANRMLLGVNDVMRTNSRLIIRNESHKSDNSRVTGKGRIILDELRITPYLLYTEKNPAPLRVENRYTNSNLINNTASGTISYSLEDNDEEATINASTGEVTALKAGEVTVKATWSEGAYTTYTLTIIPKNCETFNQLSKMCIVAPGASSCSEEPVTDVLDNGISWTYWLGGGNTAIFGDNAMYLRARKSTETAEDYGYLRSDSIPGGLSSITFRWNQGGNESGLNYNIKVKVNGNVVGSITETGQSAAYATAQVFSMTDLSYTGKVVIEIVNETAYDNTSNKGRFVFDNLSWEGYEVPTISLNEEADNSTILSTYSDAFVNVNTDRSLVANVWNTLCMPFALSKSVDLEDAEVQELSACTADGDALTVSFTEVVDDELEAGKPYLVKPSSNISLTGFTDKQITDVPQSITKGVITFHGIFSPTTLTGGDMNTLFVGTPNAAGNNLFYPLSDSSLKGMRAYFTIDAGAGAPLFRTARFVVEEKKLPTAVDDVRGQEVTVEKLIEDGHVIIIRDGKRYNVLGAQE